jgi:hypothetical protein
MVGKKRKQQVEKAAGESKVSPESMVALAEEMLNSGNIFGAIALIEGLIQKEKLLPTTEAKCRLLVANWLVQVDILRNGPVVGCWHARRLSPLLGPLLSCSTRQTPIGRAFNSRPRMR